MTDRDWQNLWIGLVETNSVALRHFDPQIRTTAVRIQMGLFNAYNIVAQNPSGDKALEIYNFLQELHSKYAIELLELHRTQSPLETIIS